MQYLASNFKNFSGGDVPPGPPYIFSGFALDLGALRPSYQPSEKNQWISSFLSAIPGIYLYIIGKLF